MKAILLTLLLGLSFTFLKSQSAADCDIATSGVSIVNANNTAPVARICVGQTAKFKFSIFNAGSDPGCTIPANSIEAVFSLPASRYSYNGPPSFSTGRFTWTYSVSDRALIGTNTTAIPNGDGDADVLVSVIGNSDGAASSVLNITQNGPTSDNTSNNNGSAQLTVNALPTATISYSGSPYCNVGTATVMQTGQTGGTYSVSPAGLSLDGNMGEINLATSAPGNYTVTYSFSNANCSSTTSAPITVTAKPTASINYSGSSFCTTASPASPTLTGTGAYIGGTYSSTTGLTIDPTTGTITPASSTASTYTVTYSTPAGGGCAPVNTTTIVTITAQPTASISYMGTPYCTTVTSASPSLSGTGAYINGTYSSTTGLSINTTTGVVNPNASTPGNYTVTYLTPASGGCAAINASTGITITAQPTAFISYTGSPFCTTASPVSPTLIGSGAYTGGTYSAPTGLTIEPTTGQITPFSSTAGMYIVTYTTPSSEGCAAVSTTTNVAITAQPTVTVSYNGSPYCTTVTSAFPTVSGSGAYINGSFGSTTGLTLNTTSGEINPSASTAGSYVVTYTTPASGGCEAVSNTANVTITAAPNAGTLSGNQSICVGGTTTFTSSGGQSGGIFSSSNTSVATVNSSTGDITGVAAGTAIITYTIAGGAGCGDATATRNVMVTAAPTANLAYTGSPYCTTVTSAAPTLTGTGAYMNGTYTSTTGLTLNITTGEITPSTSTPGSYTITYTTQSSGACGAVSTTANIMITAQPTASVSYMSSPFCATITSVMPMLSGTGAYTGGTYTGPSGLTINSSTGEINPSTSMAGNYSITYSTPNGGGCAPVSTTANITITAQPTASISYGNAAYCTTVTSATPTLTGSGAYTGGTYSSTSGLFINSSNGEINPSASTPATYTVTYTTTASGGCSSVSTTTSVTITAQPTAFISYSGTPYCTTTMSATPTLTGTGAYMGGSYSAPSGLTISTTTGEINPSTSTPGTYTINYNTTPSGGCGPVNTTTNVTITAAPNAGTLNGNQAICTGSTTTFTTNGQSGGSYSSDNTSVATVNSATGMVTGVSAGTATIIYTVMGAGNCANASTTLTIMVTTAPNAGILDGDQAICVGGNTTFNSNGQSGGTYSSSNTDVATVNPTTGVITGTGAGTATITYTVTGSGGCGNATATRDVVVTAAPNAGMLSGNQSICVGGTTTFTSSGGQSGGTYTSSDINVATVNVSNGVVTGVAAGNAVITYTVASSGGCSNATATRTVTVSTPPNAGMLSGNNAICVGGTTTFVSDGQSGGTFTSSNTSIATVDASTGMVTGVAAGNATITYTVVGSGGCGNATATTLVTVSAPPDAGMLSGTQNICAGSSTTFTSNGQGGGTYSSDNTGVATVNPSSGVVTGVAAGTATITYTVTGTGGCGNATATKMVTVSAPPNAGTLSGNQSICVGGTTTFISTGQSGGSYTSSNTNVATINANTGDITGVSAGTATITYTVTGSGGCGNATAARNINVNALPQGSISGTTTATQSNATTSLITFTGSGGTVPYTFTYNINGGSTQTISTTGTNTSVTVNQSNAVMGTYTYTLLSTTSAAGCTSTNALPATATVTVTDAQPFDLFATIPRPLSTNFFTGQQSEGYVQISNSSANPTTGQVVFRISKVSNFTLSIPANMTTAAGTSVNNSDWIITDNGFSYTITSTKATAIGANSNIRIGFILTATGNFNTSGIMTLGILDDTGGISTGRGDNNSSNNQAIKIFTIN